MFQHAEIHDPTYVRCSTLDDGPAWVKVGDRDGYGVTVGFDSETTLRGFLLALVRAAGDPEVWFAITPDPSQDWATDLAIDHQIEETP